MIVLHSLSIIISPSKVNVLKNYEISKSFLLAPSAGPLNLTTRVRHIYTYFNQTR